MARIGRPAVAARSVGERGRNRGRSVGERGRDRHKRLWAHCGGEGSAPVHGATMRTDRFVGMRCRASVGMHSALGDGMRSMDRNLWTPIRQGDLESENRGNAGHGRCIRIDPLHSGMGTMLAFAFVGMGDGASPMERIA